MAKKRFDVEESAGESVPGGSFGLKALIGVSMVLEILTLANRADERVLLLVKTGMGGVFAVLAIKERKEIAEGIRKVLGMGKAEAAV